MTGSPCHTWGCSDYKHLSETKAGGVWQELGHNESCLPASRGWGQTGRVGLCCYNRMPEAESFAKNRDFFLVVLEAWKPWEVPSQGRRPRAGDRESVRQKSQPQAHL